MKMCDPIDQEKAFAWIEEQDWAPKKKADARYRWRKRHAPDTIQRRRTKECSICCYARQLYFFQAQQQKCVHFPMICKKCRVRLDRCPYCRQVWKERQETPSRPIVMIISSFAEIELIEQILSQLNIDVRILFPV